MTATLKRILSDPDCCKFREGQCFNANDIEAEFEIGSNGKLHHKLHDGVSAIKDFNIFHLMLGVIEDLEYEISKQNRKEYYRTGKIHDPELMGKINENYQYLATYILRSPIPCKEEKKPQKEVKKEEKPVEKPPVFSDRSSAVAVDPGFYIPDTWIEIGEENRDLQGYETSVTPVF
jgi:hypothetical protein